jgi:hypothetical protein
MNEELLAVARQAVEYTREYANKPKFVERAEKVIAVAEAIRLGETVGQQQGWDVFETDDRWMVQRDDEQEKIDDNEAIRLARLAGVVCNDDGELIGKDRKVIIL